MVTNVTDAELLEGLRSGPMGRKLLAEREERRLAERKDWAGEIERLEAEAGGEMKPLDDAVAAAAERVEMAKIALKEATEAHRGARFNRATAANRFSHRRHLLQARPRCRGRGSRGASPRRAGRRIDGPATFWCPWLCRFTAGPHQRSRARTG